MKSIIFIFTCSLVLTVLVIAFNSKKVMSDFCDEFEKDKLFCSCRSTERNIEFCVSLRRVVAPDGNKIVVNDQIRNLNKDSVVVPVRGQFEHLNYIKITESNGNKLLSKKEAAQLAQKALPPDQRIIELEMSSAPFEHELAPGEFVRSAYNLDDFFELKPRVDYKISIGRKINISNQRLEEGIITISDKINIDDK